jgi:hypothetical protein
MKDFVVYTAITRGYDDLARPLDLWREEADFVAFMETPAATPGWEIRPIYRRFRDPCRNAKIHKILAHRYFPKAKYSLWMDGSMVACSPLPLSIWVKQYLSGRDLAVFRHRCRNCIYQEAARCLTGGLDASTVIARQMRRYRRAGYPVHNGLAECTVLFRRHTKEMNRLNEAWYREVHAYSKRDQLSFNFVAHQLGFRYALLPGNTLDNEHCIWLEHKRPVR